MTFPVVAAAIVAAKIASDAGALPASEPTMAQRRDAAMVYALWDSENSVKLEKPAQYDEYLPRAFKLNTWLTMHGWTLVPTAALEGTAAIEREQRRTVRRLCWALGMVSGVTIVLALRAAL